MKNLVARRDKLTKRAHLYLENCLHSFISELASLSASALTSVAEQEFKQAHRRAVQGERGPLRG